jgi:predicted secreted protein
MATTYDEPTLQGIEDYNNNESDEKRKTVRLVIITGLIIGLFYTIAKTNFNSVEDEISTKSGINVTKNSY